MLTEVSPIPDGYRSVTPYIMVNNPQKALEFYTQALGATVRHQMEINPGEIVHAEFQVGDSIIMMAADHPSMQLEPLKGDHRPVCFMVYVPDVDRAAERALAAGMKMIRVVQDQFYGDRTGTFEDPFGHIWTLGTRKENVSLEEAKKRAQYIYN